MNLKLPGVARIVFNYERAEHYQRLILTIQQNDNNGQHIGREHVIELFADNPGMADYLYHIFCAVLQVQGDPSSSPGCAEGDSE
jgi:hypothetical protein